MSELVHDRDLKQSKVNNNLKIGELSLEEAKKSLMENTKNEDDTDFNNLSYLLNMLDGIYEISGRIVVMTTNKPEVLDKALIRPGRIDIKINFKNCNHNTMKQIIDYYYDQNIDIELINNIPQNVVSPATLINYCQNNENVHDLLTELYKIKF